MIGPGRALVLVAAAGACVFMRPAIAVHADTKCGFDGVPDCPVITDVTPRHLDLPLAPGATLKVSGTSLGGGAVFLEPGDISLTIVGGTSTQIQVALPDTLDPGTYHLEDRLPGQVLNVSSSANLIALPAAPPPPPPTAPPVQAATAAAPSAVPAPPATQAPASVVDAVPAASTASSGGRLGGGLLVFGLSFFIGGAVILVLAQRLRLARHLPGRLDEDAMDGTAALAAEDRSLRALRAGLRGPLQPHDGAGGVAAPPDMRRFVAPSPQRPTTRAEQASVPAAPLPESSPVLANGGSAPAGAAIWAPSDEPAAQVVPPVPVREPAQPQITPAGKRLLDDLQAAVASADALLPIAHHASAEHTTSSSGRPASGDASPPPPAPATPTALTPPTEEAPPTRIRISGTGMRSAAPSLPRTIDPSMPRQRLSELAAERRASDGGAPVAPQRAFPVTPQRALPTPTRSGRYDDSAVVAPLFTSLPWAAGLVPSLPSTTTSGTDAPSGSGTHDTEPRHS